MMRALGETAVIVGIFAMAAALLFLGHGFGL